MSWYLGMDENKCIGEGLRRRNGVNLQAQGILNSFCCEQTKHLSCGAT